MTTTGTERPSPYDPLVKKRRGSTDFSNLFGIPLAPIGKLMHRPYRNLAAQRLDMTEIKRDLESLRGIWIPKKRWQIYHELINAIEKITHNIWDASDQVQVRSQERLQRELERDVENLRQELDTYFKPAHPEVTFAEKIFKVTGFIQELFQEMSLAGTSMAQEDKTCAALKQQQDCEAKHQCAWEPKRFSLSPPCKYRPLRKTKKAAADITHVQKKDKKEPEIYRLDG